MPNNSPCPLGLINQTNVKGLIRRKIAEKNRGGRPIRTTRIGADVLRHLEQIVVVEIDRQIERNAAHATMKASTAVAPAPRRRRGNL